MQSIRSIRLESNGTGPATYAVELVPRFEGERQVVSGLKRSEVASYPALQLALALRGLVLYVAEVEVEPRSQRRATWLQIVAAAIQRGQQVEEQQAEPAKRPRRQ